MNRAAPLGAVSGKARGDRTHTEGLMSPLAGLEDSSSCSFTHGCAVGETTSAAPRPFRCQSEIILPLMGAPSRS
jgi:hypothetical protein